LKEDFEKLQAEILKSAHREDLKRTAEILLRLGRVYREVNMRPCP